MNFQQTQQRDELISILWKLKNATASDGAHAYDFHDLLHDKKIRADFLAQAANSDYSEIRHAAHRARELDALQTLES